MNYFEFIKKTLSRIVVCALIAGLATPYTLLDTMQTANSSVYAVEASASDLFIGTPLENVRCSLYTDGEKSFNINGRTYYQGIVMGDGTYTDNAEISYNVEGTENISFDLGHVDNTDESKAEFSIYLDDILEDKFTLSCSQPIEKYELKTSGASKLKIVRTGDLSKYALANITVDGTAPAKTCTVPEYKTTAAFLGSNYDVRSFTYDGFSNENFFMMNGRQYYQGIVMGDGSYTDNAYISFNVENVKTLSFSLGHVDNSDSSSAEFSLYLDNILEDKITLSQNEMILEYTVDVSDASTVRIVRNGDCSKYGIADISVDNLPPATTYSTPAYKTSAAFVSSIYDNYRTKVYDGYSSAISFNINGRSYYQGIVLGDGSYNDDAAFSVNVEKLKTLSFTLGHVDNSDASASEFCIYLDNVLEDKFTLSQNEPVKEYTIDVSNASTLRVFRNGDCSQYALADIKADELTPKNSYSVPQYKNSAEVVGGIYDNFRTSVYDGISGSVFFNMSGRKYFQGIILGDGSYNDDSAFSLNVENLKTISFDLGHVDDSAQNECELSIYLDNQMIDKLKLTGNMLIEPYTLDVTDASTLRIVRNGDCSRFALGDIIADELTPKNVHTVPVYTSSAKFVDSAYNVTRTVKYIDDNKFTFFTINGVNYTQGITIGDDSYNDNAYASFNVENLDSVSFTVGHADERKATEATLKIYCDNELAQTINLSGDIVPKEYTIDVSKASTIIFTKDNDCGTYGLGNFQIKASLTEDPPAVTTPAVTSTAPVVTSVPTVTTKTPVSTSVPKVTTKAPVSTSVPKVTTKAPVVTSIPVVTTKAPVVTSIPVVTTKAPVVTSVQNPSTKLKGDLNGDGNLTKSDVRILLQSLVGSYTLTDEGKVLADVDNDGNLTSTDAAGISKAITVKPTTCSVEAEKTSVSKLLIYLPEDPTGPKKVITTTVVIPAGTGVTNGILTLHYDPEQVSISKSSLDGTLVGRGLENAMVEINEILEGVVKIAFISSKPLNEEGYIGFDFSGKKDCFTSVQIDADEFFATDNDGTAVPISVEGGNTSFDILSSVETPSRYDINGDGIVSAPDLIVMADCIFSPDSVKPEVLKRADLNNNGIVNVFDMIRLKKYLLSYSDK